MLFNFPKLCRPSVKCPRQIHFAVLPSIFTNMFSSCVSSGNGIGVTGVSIDQFKLLRLSTIICLSVVVISRKAPIPLIIYILCHSLPRLALDCCITSNIVFFNFLRSLSLPFIVLYINRVFHHFHFLH